MLGQTSRLGALLDPLVDRLYVVTTLVTFVARDFIPWWVAAILIGRDLLLALTLPIYRRRGLPPPEVVYLGKAATFLLMFALPLILAGHGDWAIGPFTHAFGFAFLIWGTVLYVWTAAIYVLKAVDVATNARGRAPMKSTGEDVRRNPVPSLLRSLMTEHLDPGYEATAFERQHEHTKNRPSKTGPWLALGALLIGFIVTVSAVQATKQVTGTEEVRSELVAKVRDAEDRIDSLAASRDSLGGAVDAARGVALEGDARGSAVLDQLRAVESGAGAEAVHGEGLVVTLTDPAGRPNLSDASQRSVGARPSFSIAICRPSSTRCGRAAPRQSPSAACESGRR